MASITKKNDENSMTGGSSAGSGDDARNEIIDAPVTDIEPSRGDGISVSSGPTIEGPPGFFHIYKSGQGYWTRMGTVAGAALLVLLIGDFLYTFLPTWSDKVREHKPLLIGIVLAVIAALSAVVFWIINKPRNADFLIATDSEMKKVNWTSRAELMGSTKIVIIFVFLITALLFGIDIIFGYLFYFLKVLKQPPF